MNEQLEQKVEVIQIIQPYRTLASELKCSIGNIYKINKEKNEINEAFNANEPPSKKRIAKRKNQYHDINVLIIKFLKLDRLTYQYLDH